VIAMTMMTTMIAARFSDSPKLPAFDATSAGRFALTALNSIRIVRRPWE
jgi:hypothetical protein